MKRISFIISFLIAFAFFNSCDDITPPYLEDGGGVVIDTTKKRVFLEEFTGHRCNNCPAATRIAKQLKQIYGDNLVIMQIHAGTLSFPSTAPFEYNFRNDIGLAIDQYYKAASVLGTPIGLVNRAEFKDRFTVSPTEWSQAIDAQLEQTAKLELDIRPTFNPSNGIIDIEVDVDFRADVEDASIAVYILESGIVKPQKDREQNPQDVMDYVHDHILRDSFNGAFGNPIENAPFSDGDFQTLSFNYPIPNDSDWVVDNLSFVALVFDTQTREILQVREKYLVE